MHRSRHHTSRRFTRVGDQLVWRQRNPEGTPWIQRCWKAAFKRAVKTLEAGAATGYTLVELADAAQLSINEAAVTVNFLLDAGFLKTDGHIARRFIPRDEGLYADAMRAWRDLPASPEAPLPLLDALGP
jgi:hypothetical protein